MQLDGNELSTAPEDTAPEDTANDTQNTAFLLSLQSRQGRANKRAPQEQTPCFSE